MLRYSDIPEIKYHINRRFQRICELERMEPSPERLAEIARIEKEAKILQKTLRDLKGNTYPYAV